jgi:hypothetical protein
MHVRIMTLRMPEDEFLLFQDNVTRRTSQNQFVRQLVLKDLESKLGGKLVRLNNADGFDTEGELLLLKPNGGLYRLDVGGAIGEFFSNGIGFNYTELVGRQADGRSIRVTEAPREVSQGSDPGAAEEKVRSAG